MSKYLCLAIFVLLFSASCHKSTNDGIFYTNDSVSIEMDYTKTTYREKGKGKGYYIEVKAQKHAQAPISYTISLSAYDEILPRLNMTISMLKMPDGSFRLDSTNYNAIQIYQNAIDFQWYKYPTGPVIIIHDGTDYLRGSFDGTILSNGVLKQIKCSFRAEWESN